MRPSAVTRTRSLISVTCCKRDRAADGRHNAGALPMQTRRSAHCARHAMNHPIPSPAPRRAPTPRGARRVVIVGGGFTGASAAIQLVRGSTLPLSVTIIDPAERAGRGLAYQALDPDHRLNAPSFVHSLIPDDTWHFSRWCLGEGLPERDPAALSPDGSLYLRRADFGRYIEQTLQAHASWPGTGSTIDHVRDHAVDLSPPSQPLAVSTAGGHRLPADLLFVATGNPLPRLPRPFDPAWAAHPAVIENPLDTPRLHAISPQARVLLVGSGLTALDVLSTLVRRQHSGEILVVSRHGLRPRPQGPLPEALTQATSLQALALLPGGALLDRIAGPPPVFLSADDVPRTALRWLRALRAEIARIEAGGGLWYQPFDDLRDAVWQLWPTLPAPEKRRFQRRLRTWYDVHRYRSPPQNQGIVDAALAEGRIRFVAARLQSASAVAEDRGIAVAWRQPGESAARQQVFDTVINCTGLDALAGLSSNPFLVSAIQRGWLRRDACAMGLEVDARCCAVGADGTVRPTLRLVGPPTVGTFGDPIGAMFIAAQIHRLLPDALHTLAGAGPADVTDVRQ